MKTGFLRAMALLLLAFAASAVAENFYFLPPNDPDWLRKTPYIVDMQNATARKMNLDFNTCGWYKIDLNATERVSERVVIWQGKPAANMKTDLSDRVGLKGLDEGSSEWTGGVPIPTPINFGERFTTVGPTLYFDPSKGETGWGSDGTVQSIVQKNRCSYTMAGIIYDTDQSLMNSFNHSKSDAGGGDGSGIARGIAKPKLVPNEKNIPKMQFNNGLNGWESGDFTTAFNCSPGKNAMVCYDVPFARDNVGLWTFDSDQLCEDGSIDLTRPYPPSGVKTFPDANQKCGGSGGGLVGGFFPNRLNGMQQGMDDNPVLDANCSYLNCGACYNPATSHGFVQLGNTISPYCFERGRLSSGGSSCNQSNCCGAAYGSGTFKNFDTPKVWQDWGQSGQAVTSGDKNEYFCFETHAEFTYEEGQEFFFRGDDDIWVFINGRIVIDLGGTHLATPGYVALDSIGVSGTRWANAFAVSSVNDPSEPLYPKLKPDSSYALDIFFCDRRRTMSNIRISTNMYIVQKNGLFVKSGSGTTSTANVCLTQEGGGSCAAVLEGGGSGTQERCGGLVAGFIDFYIINRRGEGKEILNSDNPNCKPTATQGELLCYGGITVNEGIGTARVDKNKVINLPGTWYLYAQVKEDKAQQMNPPPDSVKIAQFASAINVRMAWGNIREGSSTGKVLTNICKQQITVATASELAPVCVIAGDGSNGNFVVDDVTEAAGTPFTLEQAGFVNDKGAELEVYFDSLGKNKLTREQISAPYQIPNKNNVTQNSGSVAGVFVFWVAGNINQEIEEFDYKINASKSKGEAVTLRSVIPTLEWITAPGSTTPIPGGASGHQKFSKWLNNDPMQGALIDNGKIVPEWVGGKISLNLRAYRQDGATKIPCKTCNFDLKLYDAQAYGPGAPTVSAPSELITINPSNFKITNGEGNITIAGRKEVKEDAFAKMVIQGISTKPRQEIGWDSLQFEDPPTPRPDVVQIFDVDGDGVADSLVITYNRGFRRDSLPSMIEVFWDKDTTVRYGIGKPELEGKETVYKSSSIPGNTKAEKEANNRTYWKPYLRLQGGADIDTRDNSISKEDIGNMRDAIVLVRGPKGEQSINFSNEVLTKSNGQNDVSSWMSFDYKGIEKTDALTSEIEDKVPAIVISAKYFPGELPNCGTEGYACPDRIILEFSEPLKADPGITPDVTEIEKKNPFAYKLRDLGDTVWKILDVNVVPPSIKFYGSRDNEPAGLAQDSIVDFYFQRWRGDGRGSRTPMPGDSVKFAVVGKYSFGNNNILVDGSGNPPNPREWGREIEGKKPFNAEKIPIGEVDPTNPNLAGDNANRVIDSIGGTPPVGPGGGNALFNPSRPVEILPVPPTWTVKDAQKNYGGTVGILLNPDIFNELADYNVPDEAILIYARVFYHTNLGSYVADRTIKLKCNDDIFPKNEHGEHSCRESRSQIYIAWDMKDFKGRLVGTGAYVGLYDFYWMVHPEVAADNGISSDKRAKLERKVEMHGVKRTKKK